MDTYEIIQDWDFSVRVAELFMQTINPLELRKIGDKWIKRLKSLDEIQNKSLREHVMKLMLLSLRHNRLVGPFKHKPPREIKKLEAIFSRYKSSQITTKIMHEAFTDMLTMEPMPPLPVSTECYTILQLIPKYGGHYFDTSSLEAIKSSNDLKKRDLPFGAAFIFPAYCSRNLYYPENDTRAISQILERLPKA